MEIKEIFTSKKIVLEWNSPLSKASWRQRKRRHHLPYLMH